MHKEEIKKLLKLGWIKALLIFDTQAVKKEAVKELLKGHLEKMRKLESIKIAEEKFSSVEKTEPVPQIKERGITEVYSQVLEVVVLAKDFEALVNLAISFGPTAIEILEPETITLTIRQAQNSLLSMVEIMHMFASAGVGGFVLSK